MIDELRTIKWCYHKDDCVTGGREAERVDGTLLNDSPQTQVRVALGLVTDYSLVRRKASRRTLEKRCQSRK